MKVLSLEEATSVVTCEIRDCLGQVSSADVDAMLKEIIAAKRIFLMAAGRSALGIRGFAMRLMHMGKTVHVIGEVTTPALAADDLLIVGSGSGRTESLIAVATKAKAIGARIVVITINPQSPLAVLSDHIVKIPASSPKADVNRSVRSIQPMGSLFEQCLFLLLDACVLRLMQLENIDADAMFARHANLE